MKESNIILYETEEGKINIDVLLYGLVKKV